MKVKTIFYPVLALPILPAAVSCDNDDVRQPNVLLILTDDQGWGDLGINGNTVIRTPAIDSLFEESAVVDRFMVSPLSAPTRASILTGRYHLRTGVSSVQSGQENMSPDETTLAELFRAAGYSTGCFGKWHNGAYYPYTPNGQGFDEFLGFCCGHWANYFDPLLQKNETMFRGEGYITDIFTDAAVDFIRKHRNGPFFCYVPYNAPHSPFQVPDEYFDYYYGLLGNMEEKDRAALASVYGMVECVDRNVSRLLSVLDELKIRENTIVIFMSDNGPVHVTRYNGDMRGGKGSVHEGGVRVPFCISWKNHIEHRHLTDIQAHIDILPTLMELCGIRDYETAFPIDGISFAGELYGNDMQAGDRTIFTHRRQQEMAPYLGGGRTSRYRIGIYPDGKVTLYDMVADPSETENIFDSLNPKHKGLYEDYMKWYKEASQGVDDAAQSVPVGYDEALQVRIPAPEGRMYGKLKCYGYPNQNWVNHFVSVADSLVFTLNAVSSGKYRIYADYCCEEDTPEAMLHVSVSGQTVSAPIPLFSAIPRYSPDRVERDEAPDLDWNRLYAGTVNIDEGTQVLKLSVTGIKSVNSLKIKTIILEKQL